MKAIHIQVIGGFLATLLLAQTPGPALTTEQKLEIRDAQLKLEQLTQQKTALESQYKDVMVSGEKAVKALNDLIAKYTPKGYSISLTDLALIKQEDKQADKK